MRSLYYTYNALHYKYVQEIHIMKCTYAYALLLFL